MIDYCFQNGGTSRYTRIRYFYENILNKSIQNNEVLKLAESYSEIVKQDVIDVAPVIGAMEFLGKNHKTFTFAIVSGSDQNELRDICRKRNIAQYFFDILGFPVEKEINLKNLITANQWQPQECIYIGDAITDYNAAKFAEIDFIARHSGTTNWERMNIPYINDLTELTLKLPKEKNSKRFNGL